MTCSTSLSGKNRIVLIAGILMIATTLRVTFTGAAPLLDTIRSAYSLTTAQTGLLTTLPLLAFALISPLAAPVARRFGMERSLFAALLLICAGIAIRSLPSPYLLFGGTAVIGGGIALGNVLLPGLIKRDFPHSVARLTGAYSLTMGAAAALGSAMVVPLALNGFGWQGALLMLMCFPLLALFLWLPQWRSQQHANLSTSRALHTRGIWRSPLAWQVTLFLGINSLVYYVIIGWLPAILISHGYSEAQAKDAGISLTDHQKNQLIAYVNMLHKWNKAYNLTSVRDPNEMLVRHILDSIVVAPYLQGERFIDVGTGPGLPGIPLSIVNQLVVCYIQLNNTSRHLWGDRNLFCAYFSVACPRRLHVIIPQPPSGKKRRGWRYASRRRQWSSPAR